MSSSSDAKKQLVTLKGSQNYLQWCTSMKAFLQMTGSWTYADNDVVQPVVPAEVAAWQTTRDKCLGTIVIYCSGLVQQAITALDNPHTVWNTLQTTYGTLGAAGIYVEFRNAVRMQIRENEDPNPRIQEMQSVFSYLATNGLTLPDSARAMILLSALPSKWEGFASTILATLPVVAPAAGGVALTFATVLLKIQEEWSRRSNSSVMPREVKKERQQNVQAGPSKKPLCQKCKKTGHTTSEHRDNYHPTYSFHSPPSIQNPLPKKTSQKRRKIIKGRVNSTMTLFKLHQSSNSIQTIQTIQGMPHKLWKQAGLCSHPHQTSLLQNLHQCMSAGRERRSWTMIMHVDRHYVNPCILLTTTMTTMATSTIPITQM